MTEPMSPSVCRNAKWKTARRVSAVVRSPVAARRQAERFGTSTPKRDCARRRSAATLNGENYAASKAGTGNAVTDLIFSMANLDVTFFNATAPISFL